MYGQFLVIFALILTGYFFRKINITSDEMNKGLNKFIVYFSFPCFIFYKVSGIEITIGFFEDFMIAVVLSILLFLIFGLYVFGYTKRRHFPKEDAGSAEMMMIFSNNAFMGFPITYIFFGDMGLLLMLANNIAMNLMIFSYGLFILRRNDDKKGFSLKNLLKCFLNPNILAWAFGMIFYLFQIHIPSEADAYLVYIGSICTPMAMIFIGSTLVGTNILQVMKDRVVLESAINKNLIMPVISYMILVFLPISEMIKAIVIFAACFPSAAVASVVVETEGKNSALACKILVVSTAVSIVSLPIAVNLINLLIL